MNMESLLNWGGPGYPSYDGQLNTATVTPPAAPAAAPSSGAPAASPTAAVTPPPAPAAGTGAPPATPTGTSPTDGNDANIAILRQSHENLRSLGVDFNTAKTYTDTMRTLATEGLTLAQQLGYTKESFAEAFKEDPVGTMATLRGEAHQVRSRPPDPNAEAINRAVDQRVAPLNQFVARQQAEKANGFIEGEFSTMFDAHPVFKAIKDPDVRQDIKDRYIETVKWNSDTLKEVMEGKSSGLKKIFDEVANNWVKVQQAYAKIGQPAPSGGQPGAAKPGNGAAPEFDLDDIIEGTDKANFLPSMRGFRT